MSKNSIIILVLSILFVVAAGALYIYVNNMPKTKPVQEMEFKLPEEEPSNTKDIENVTYVDFSFENSDGNLTKLSESQDMAAMVLFWNPDNADSVDVLKKVDSNRKKTSPFCLCAYEEKINFYMINTSDKTPKNLEDELTIDIYYDNLKEGTSKFYITEIPSMIYIQKNNEVLHAKSGLTSTDALEANLDILSENF